MPLVVLLRGVNVGGHRTMRPKELAAKLAEFDVLNIGAAGTFVVRKRVSQARLRTALQAHLPVETEVMICEGREIAALAATDHFTGLPRTADIVRFFTVLARAPKKGPELPFDLPADGPWQMRLVGREGRYVVGAYRRQMQAIRHLGAIDRLFGEPGTTRNWNTLERIVAALDR